MTESVIQTQIVAWLSLVARRYGFLFFAPCNETLLAAVWSSNSDRIEVVNGKRSLPQRIKIKIYALINRFKKMGFTPGVSDLIIGHSGQMFCMELKDEKGTQSDDQKFFQAWCSSCGIPYRVVRSLDEAQQVMVEWGIIGGGIK